MTPNATEHAVVTRILAHLERRGVEARGEAGGLPGDEGRAGEGRRKVADRGA